MTDQNIESYGIKRSGIIIIYLLLFLLPNLFTGCVLFVDYKTIGENYVFLSNDIDSFFLRFNFFKYVYKEGWIRYLRKSKKFQFPSQERLLDMIVHIRAHAIWTFNEHQMYLQTYLIVTACFYLYISITCLLMFYLL